MKKIKTLLTVILAVMLCLVAFSCKADQPIEEIAPTVAITSGNANITTAESYTLAFTATNAKTTKVTITEKDGKTTGQYVESSKTFTATEAGTYTLTVKVTNVTKSAESAVTVHVTLASDTTPPELTFTTEPLELYKTAVAVDVLLPLATVNDNHDGDITNAMEVTVTTKGATLTKVATGYSFTSKTAGKYMISYYAVDAANNEVEKFLYVMVTPTKAETTVTAEENDLNNLATSGLPFKENFMNGYSGAFAKGLSFSTAEGAPQASIVATNEAIAGNSLIIDYSSCAYDSNTSYWFGALDGKIKSGKWTISMDVTVLGGTAPGGLYFSFIHNGEISGDNSPQSLGAVNVKKTLSFEAIKTFDTSKEWMFRTFFFTGDTTYKYDNFKIAIDNISFTWKDVVDATVIRTGTPKTISETDLDGNGYTITGADDNFTALNGSMLYLDKSKLVKGDRLTTEQAALLTPENGFSSNYVIYADTQICSFTSLKNRCNDPSYSYKLTYKVYSPQANGWHVFFTDGSGAQSKAVGQADLSGVATWTTTFDGAENFVNIGLYNSGNSPLYIGEISIQRTLIVTNPIVTRTGTPKTLTAANLIGSGYTVTGADNNYSALSGNGKPTYVQLDKMVASGKMTAAEYANLTATNGFNSPYAIFLTSEISNFDVLKGLLIDPLKDYTITYKAYAVGVAATNWHMWNGTSLTSVSGVTGLKTLTKTIAGNAANAELGVYCQGNAQESFLLIGDITIVSADRVISSTTPKGFKVGKTWTFDAATFTPVGGDKFTKMNSADVKLSDNTPLSAQAGFGEKVLACQFTGDSTKELTRCGEIMEANCDYEITFVVYIESINMPLHARLDSDFIALTSATGVQTLKFTKTGVVDFLSLYTAGGADVKVFLSSFSIKLTAIK